MYNAHKYSNVTADCAANKQPYSTPHRDANWLSDGPANTQSYRTPHHGAHGAAVALA